MARTPRTFSSRGRAEAKAGENTRQGKSREDVTEKGKQTNQAARNLGDLTDSESELLCVSDWVAAWFAQRPFSSHSARTGPFPRAQKMQRS